MPETSTAWSSGVPSRDRATRRCSSPQPPRRRGSGQCYALLAPSGWDADVADVLTAQQVVPKAAAGPRGRRLHPGGRRPQMTHFGHDMHAARNTSFGHGPCGRGKGVGGGGAAPAGGVPGSRGGGAASPGFAIFLAPYVRTVRIRKRTVRTYAYGTRCQGPPTVCVLRSTQNGRLRMRTAPAGGGWRRLPPTPGQAPRVNACAGRVWGGDACTRVSTCGTHATRKNQPC
jgi:hypothetical protein